MDFPKLYKWVTSFTNYYKTPVTRNITSPMYKLHTLLMDFVNAISFDAVAAESF